jgi:hypothetical protein
MAAFIHFIQVQEVFVLRSVQLKIHKSRNKKEESFRTCTCNEHTCYLLLDFSFAVYLRLTCKNGFGSVNDKAVGCVTAKVVVGHAAKPFSWPSSAVQLFMTCLSSVTALRLASSFRGLLFSASCFPLTSYLYINTKRHPLTSYLYVSTKTHPLTSYLYINTKRHIR